MEGKVPQRKLSWQIRDLASHLDSVADLTDALQSKAYEDDQFEVGDLLFTLTTDLIDAAHNLRMSSIRSVSSDPDVA